MVFSSALAFAPAARLARRRRGALAPLRALIHPARALLLLTLPALALLLGGCETLSNSKLGTVGAEYWQAEPSGTIQGSSGATIGAPLDVEDTLDQDGDGVWVWNFGAAVGPTRLEVSWIDLETSGVATATQAFSFGQVALDPGEVVQSQVDTTVLQIHTATPAMKFGKIGSLGIVAGVDSLDISSQVVNLTDATSWKESFDQWVPVLGLVGAASYPVFDFAIFVDGKVSGMVESISLGTFDGDYLSWFLRGGLDIDDGFKIGVGFRAIDTDIDDGQDDIEVELEGGFLFAEFNF